jgi:hypothetical protein
VRLSPPCRIGILEGSARTDEDRSLGWYAGLFAITDQVFGSSGMFVSPGVLSFVFSVPHNR